MEKSMDNGSLFELYVQDNLLIINNINYFNDSCVINLNTILNLEINRELTFLNKIIETYFGFDVPVKSNRLRIRLKKGHKDMVLTHCDIEKVKKRVYEINQLILKKENEINLSHHKI